MYQFIYGSFSDAALALHGVEDCLNRDLTTNDFTVYITHEGFDAFSVAEAPMVEEETEEGVKQVPSPDFDPFQHLYWKKIQKLANVVVVDIAKGVDGSDELKHVMNGAQHYLEKGRILILVNQPIQQLA